MNKTIDTLIEDVNQVLSEGVDEIPSELLDKVAQSFRNLLKSRLTKSKELKEPELRMSSIGSPCFRKTVLSITKPEESEPLTADTKLKFLYGDLVEELMLFLAELSGHRVEGRQDQQNIQGVKGHRDAVIDGTLVDVKSTSSFSYQKFKQGKLKEDDPFGYIVQLQSYLYAGQDDPLITDKNRAAFWPIDKTQGHHCLDFHEKKDWNLDEAYKVRIAEFKSGKLPDRAFEPVPDGKSGNMALGSFCSYCNMKQTCYNGEIRTFLSSKGPLFLTKVVREPKMAELLKDGTIKVLENG